MTFETFKPAAIREREGAARLASVTPVANGLIDAVRARDRRWVADVCKQVAAGHIDRDALLVCLAAKAGTDG